MPNLEMLLVCLLIVGGRIVDVTLGTVRTIMVVRGYRTWACILGFFEVLVWIFIVTRVIHGLRDNLFYGISYALGFAAGNFLGVSLDNYLALGKQAIQVFTRKGPSLAAELRAAGVRLTSFEGLGRDGPTTMLMIVTERNAIAGLAREVRRLDPDCYYTVEDVRGSAAASGYTASGWRMIMKKK
jgi:uncharacterized protein YebE (UPF0316 family)